MSIRLTIAVDQEDLYSVRTMSFPKRFGTNVKAVDEFMYCGLIASQISRFRHIRSLIGLVQRKFLAKIGVRFSRCEGVG